MLNFICKLSNRVQEKNLGEMNVELLSTDATSCSVTGNNCDFAHMTGGFLVKVYNFSVEVRNPLFDQMDSTLLSFM